MFEKEIVFVCDVIENHNTATIKTKDLETPSRSYFDEVYNALLKLTNQVTVYKSPKELIDHITDHKDSVVFSLWAGKDNRNRKALIPSICEAYHIPYVGADSYIHTICADKHLAKQLCNSYGIKTPRDQLILSASDTKKLRYLKYPVVVKPNLEGGSIGIFQRNLVDSPDDAKEICLELLENFDSILAEEYIQGQEISVCVSGTKQDIMIFQSVQVQIDGKTYFDHDIFSVETKKISPSRRSRQVNNSLLTEKEKQQLSALYASMGKVDMIRFDGRVNKDGFFLIELTPDCNLGKSSSMAMAFQTKGYSYEEMFNYLLHLAIGHPKEQENASK